MNYSFLDEFEPIKVTPPPKQIVDRTIYEEHNKICTIKEGPRFYSSTNDGNKTIKCESCGKYLKKDGVIVPQVKDSVTPIEQNESMSYFL